MRVLGIFILKSFNKCIYFYIHRSGHFKIHSALSFFLLSRSTFRFLWTSLVIMPMRDGQRWVALLAKGHCLQCSSSILTRSSRRGHHCSLQTVLYFKDMRKTTGHLEAVGRAANKDQLMEIMTALHHEAMHCFGNVHEETLVFTNSKAAALKPDTQVERIHSIVSSCHTNCIPNIFWMALRPFLCREGVNDYP